MIGMSRDKIRYMLRTGQYDLMLDPWRKNFSPLLGVISGARRRTGAASETSFVSTSSYSNRSGAFTVGMKFTVGGSSISVTQLGRFVTATGNKTRTVKIYNFNSSGEYAEVASGVIDINGVSLNTYAWIAITPVTLNAGTIYIIASDEYANDLGWASETTITTTAAATVNGSAYDDSAFPILFGNWNISAGSKSFAGVNFKYT